MRLHALIAVALAALGAPTTPFRAGERLVYQVGWMDVVRVATAEVAAQNGTGTDWHFRAEAHTEGAFRLIYALDDRFDSYAAAGTLLTRRYRMALNEQGRQLAREAGPSGLRDPLAMLYYLRTIAWQPATVVRAGVSDGQRRWRVVARPEALVDEVIVPAGRFQAVRVALVAEPEDGSAPLRLRLWLARDGRNTPVRVEAEAPIGSLRGVLTERRQP